MGLSYSFFSKSGIPVTQTQMEKMKKLETSVNWFFENPYITEIKIKFKEPLIIPKEIFLDKIVQKYDSNNRAENDDLYTDEYVYDEEFVDENENKFRVLAKLLVEYTINKEDTETMKIYEVEMWREIIN